MQETGPKNPKHIEKLHKCFVLVPEDKAGGNVIVVCKKYYLEVILNELTAVLDGSSTYVVTDSLGVDIVRKRG